MDGGIYQKWIEDIDALSTAQREEVQKILAGRSSEAEVIAALEGRLLADRVRNWVSPMRRSINRQVRGSGVNCTSRR